MNNELYVVNENGEIVDKIASSDKYVKLSEGDRVVRKNAIRYLENTVDVKYQFIKINPYVFIPYAKKYSILLSLLYYIGYMDGVLSYVNGKPVRMKDIPKICNVCESTAKKQIRGLMKDDIIHKVKDNKSKQTYLVMNPYVALIGKKIYLSLYEEFKLSEHRNNCKE